MNSALKNKYLAVSLIGSLVACSQSDIPDAPSAAEIESSQHGLTHHISAPHNSRGVSAFAGSVATVRNSNYRVRFSLGPEMPIGVAENSTHKILVGPMTPPASIEATITPYPQPERATYRFVSSTDANWSLKLFRKTGSDCSHAMEELTSNNQAVLAGYWDGLSPGATYCWRATATTYAGMAVRTGEFSLEELPVFTNGPIGRVGYAHYQGTNEVEGELSAALTSGILAYEEGNCSAKITRHKFSASSGVSSTVFFPGELSVGDQWSWETWIRTDAAGQTKDVFGTRGGNAKVRLVNDVPTLDLTLTGAANVLAGTGNLAASPWTNLANGSINVPFTVTPNYSGGMSPDGGFTATRFQRDQGTGQPNNQSWGQLVPLQGGVEYTLKVWLRSTNGEPQTVGLNINLASGAASGFNTSQSITVDGTWREHELSGTATVDDTYVVQVVRHASGWGQTVDVLAWNPRLSAGPETTITLSSSRGLTSNQWTHLAATYDGQTARLFVDGVVRAAQARAGRLADGALGSALGNQLKIDASSVANGFTGEVASMAMYDRGLAPAEVAARHQRGQAAELDGEVAWWPMDQATGASAPDISGSGLTAVLSNMANDDWVDDGNRRALDFDGSDDFVELGAAGSIPDVANKNRFVIDLDFKPRNVARQQALYSAGNNIIRIDGGNIVAQLVDANGSSHVYRGSKTMVANRWYNLRFIFQENQARWYIGGVLDHASTHLGPFPPVPNVSKSPRLGVSAFNAGTGVASEAFDGLMDNVRVIGAIGAWRFDEAGRVGTQAQGPNIDEVDSVYDSTGLRYAGHLGLNYDDDPQDGQRQTRQDNVVQFFANRTLIGPRNIVRDSRQMQLASAGGAWQNFNIGGPSGSFTVTRNHSQVAAPDGTLTAHRFQRSRSANGDEKAYSQDIYPSSGTYFPAEDRVLSFWVRSTGNTLQNYEYSIAVETRGGNITSSSHTVAVDGNWQEVTRPIPNLAQTNRISIYVVRHIDTMPQDLDVLVWGAQITSGTEVQMYQPTEANGSTYFPSARLANLPGGPSYCYSVTAVTPLGTITSYPPNTFVLPSDTEAPVITVDPVTVLAECSRPNAALLTVSEPSVVDNVDTTFFIQPFLNSQTGNVVTFPYNFPLGSSVLHWRAEDSSGNVGWSNPNQTIRVRDTVDPVVTGGAPVVIEATNPNGTPTTPSPANATDVCDPSLTTTFTPAGPFPLGDTTISFTVTDDSGNDGTGTRIVRVVDTTAPVFDPPLANTSISRDASACFQPVLPTPTARDNGYAASQLTITNSRVNGPGLPNCWDVGTHRVEWTVSDPSNNSRTVTQVIEVVAGALNIDNPRLEVVGVTNPTTGRFYNNEVHYVFGISEGTAPYQVSVVPAPDRMVANQAGTEFRAVYTAEGAYPDILVIARDDGGNGVNFGSFELAGFGIDLTPPVISAHLFDQQGVAPASVGTFPPFYRGENQPLENIWALDGAWDLANLANKLVFTGNNVVTVPPSSTPLISANAAAASIEAWVKLETLSDGTLIQIPRSGATSTSQSAMEVRVTSAGRVEFEVDGGVKTFTSAQVLQPRKWQHIAVVYGFNGGSLKIFVDGEPAAFRPSTASDSGVTLGGRPHSLIIGGRIDHNDQLTPSFDGELAELHITEADLLEDEVKSHYRGGLGRPVQAAASSALLYSFAGTTQTVLDASSRVNNGVLGLSSGTESEDPTRDAIEYPAEPASSGMERLQVIIERVDGTGSTSATGIDVTETVAGTPLAAGPRVTGGIPCNSPTNGACNSGDPMLRASVLRLWSGVPFGSYRITTIATDSAGNSARQETYVRTSNYQRALQATIAEVDALVNDPNYAGIGELEDALLSFRVALSYWTMSSQYADGSYLRADQGVQYLIEANNSGVDTLNTSRELARALYAEVDWYVEGLSNGTHPDDQGMIDTANAHMETARFEGFRKRAGYQIAASRIGYDSVAMLYPSYRPMRTALRSVTSRWEEGLGLFDQGLYTADRLRIDQVRTIQIRNLMEASRDTLENVMYPQITAALANPYTTERRTLDEIRDVLDKTSSTDVDEAGDLIAITNTALTDACLDRLAILDLDDEIFTRCYLRLNDLARFLDSVSEPLVHTYLWRAGLGLVLFNMLELSLNVSPTGLPWVTANVQFPSLNLVLPDQQAATINGAVPVSSVDLPDTLLQRAYSRYAEARGHMEAGAVNSAWAIFVDERCLLLNTYNRYYSTMRSIPTAADPKEAVIDPATVGCGN